MGGAFVLPCHADLRGELMYGIVAAWRASGELVHSAITTTRLADRPAVSFRSVYLHNK